MHEVVARFTVRIKRTHTMIEKNYANMCKGEYKWVENSNRLSVYL